MYNMDSVSHMKKGEKNVLINALKVVYEMLSDERMELGMYGVLYFLERKNVYLFRVFFFTYIKEIHNFIVIGVF